MQANNIVLNKVERKSKKLTRRKKRSYQLKAALGKKNSDKPLSKRKFEAYNNDRLAATASDVRRKGGLFATMRIMRKLLLWATVRRTNKLCLTRTKETAKVFSGTK